MHASTRNKFLVIQQLLPGLINGLISGGIAWAFHRGESAIGLWERGAYAADLLATGFFCLRSPGSSCGRCCVSRPGTARRSCSTAWPRPGLCAGWARRFGGALSISLIGLALLVGGSVLALQAMGAPEFSGNGYAVFKGVYRALVTVVLQLVMLFSALIHYGSRTAQGVTAAQIICTKPSL